MDIIFSLQSIVTKIIFPLQQHYWKSSSDENNNVIPFWNYLHLFEKIKYLLTLFKEGYHLIAKG